MNGTLDNDARKEYAAKPSPRQDPVRAIESGDIFLLGERRVVIRHHGREYVLLVTKQGKLLLNRSN